MSDANKKRKKLEAKEAEAQAKEAKRMAMTCAAEGCNARTRVEGGAKSWSKCWVCSKLYCKKHKAEYELCMSVCSEKDKEDSTVKVAAI